MNAERWNRIESLFERAAELEPGHRAAFLEEACAGDAALREEVEALLAADVEADSYLGRLNESLVGPALESALAQRDALVGSEVGSYRVLRPLGHGGMGTVYLAERTDGSFAQTVALKLVRAGLAPVLTARFRAERQILARLDHPNIARLVDGGVATDGRPWLAMEYVEGEPITDYCDRERLGVNERLALFEAVCGAVAYAHRNLVVHRDLKPSNILVTPQGDVKLLDFGIAKLLEEEAPFTVAQTRTGVRVMTPEYAAPEQVRGESVSTATDVYALGVLLYELLTGRRPYRVSTRVRREIERAILEDEPTRPSTAVAEPLPEETQTATPDALSQVRRADTQTLRRRLAGDLDQIVLTALRKEPDRRYGSADAFADDVRRHLDGLPVKAQPDTMGYRARKFVRRHRVGIVAGAFVLLAVFGGAGVALWQAAEARAERDRAETEAATAEEVTEFLVGLFGASDPAESRGDSVLVREVLERGVAQLAERLADQPTVHARLQSTLGRVYFELGRLDRADSLLTDALASGGFADPDQAAGTRLVLSGVQMRKGDFAAAVATAQAALDAARSRHAGDHDLVASALTQLGYAYVSQGRSGEAEPYLEAAAAMQERLHPEPHLDYAEALDNLGVLRYQQREYAQAAELLRRSLAIQRRLHADRPHPDLAISLDNVGAVLMAQDSLEQALPYLEESVAMQARLHPEPHPDRAVSLNNYGVLLLRTGRLDRAEQALLEALEVKRGLYGPDHPSVGITTGWLGKVARERGDLGLAEERLRRAYEIARASYAPGDGRRTGAAHALAGLLSTTEHQAEAEQLYLTVYREARDAHGLEHALTQQALRPLPGFYEAWGRPEAAARYRATSEASTSE